MSPLARAAAAIRHFGPGGSLRHAARKALRSVGERFLRAADRIPRPLLSRGLLPLSDREALQRNRVFRDRHRGRRAFVIGNGTSLREQDLSPLGDEITLVVNSFCNHAVVERWQPTYYSLMDPLLFELREPSVKEFHRTLAARIHDSTFFVPLFFYEPLLTRRLVEQEKLLPPERTFYVALDDPRSHERSLELDLTGFVHSVFNVVQFNLLAALYMGCSPVYLLGLDHDWLAHRREDQHFYEGEGVKWSLESRPPNYQDRSYRALMERQLNLWHNYETIGAIARSRGAQILNATRGGYLDVFPRADYETLIARERAAHG